MKNILMVKWFFVYYFCDVYNWFDFLMVIVMFVYGIILKVDFMKKVVKVLGVEVESVNWVINVGNERGEIVIFVLIVLESIFFFKLMVNGLVKRFEIVGVKLVEDW